MRVVRPRVNAKPLHPGDGEDVQHDGGEEVDGFGARIVRLGARPAASRRRDEGRALAQLVADALEVHDERVGRDADRDDQAGDTGEREPVALRQDRSAMTGR